MTIMAGGLRMSLGVVRRRCAGGSGTEPPRRDKDRSGEHKPDSRGRTSLPPRSSLRVAYQLLRIDGCPFSTYIVSHHEQARAVRKSSALGVRTRCMALIVFLRGINVGGNRSATEVIL